MPYFSNSVYSMQVIPYDHSPSRFCFSIRTFTPSVAPGLRSQDAKPNFWSTICQNSKVRKQCTTRIWWCKNRHCTSDKYQQSNRITLVQCLLYLIASEAYSCQCHHGQISCSNNIAGNNKQDPQLLLFKNDLIDNRKKIILETNLTWRTVAPFLPRRCNHWNIPLSYASFQIAPWPPGLPTGKSDLLINHLPSSEFTTGTNGYKNHWRNFVRAILNSWPVWVNSDSMGYKGTL